MIALCDAMVQSDQFAGAVEAQVLAPLRAAVMTKRNRVAAETAATRVDFYTLVRGRADDDGCRIARGFVDKVLSAQSPSGP